MAKDMETIYDDSKKRLSEMQEITDKLFQFNPSFEKKDISIYPILQSIGTLMSNLLTLKADILRSEPFNS